MEFIGGKIDLPAAKADLAALGVDPDDPLAQFRGPDGELVEDEAFFEWVHRSSIVDVLSR